MRQLFGLITFFLGILFAIAGVLVLLGVVEGTKRLNSPTALLLAFVFLGHGWSWMNEETVE